MPTLRMLNNEESMLEASGKEEEEQAESTTISGRKPAATRGQKAWYEGTLKAGEISRTFYHVFRSLGQVLKSDAVWEEDEFDDLAADMVGLANKLPPVKFVFKVVAPIVSLSRLAEKSAKLVKGRAKSATDSATDPAQQV